MTLFNSSRQSVAQNAWPKDLTKRLGDLAITIPLIALTLPLMALVALAIKYDSRGPVLIREEAVDTRGRRFTALKFRSTAYDHKLDGRADLRAKAGRALPQ
jgi:lipopolysaccharide/colanic/teichoic acid biosynthesis glycosyltransferase